MAYAINTTNKEAQNDKCTKSKRRHWYAKKSPQQSVQWDSQKANQKPTDKEYERDPKSPFRPEKDPEHEVPDVQVADGDFRQ